MSGWIKLYRKLSDNPLWICEPFTRGQAWVDLLMLASYEDSFFYVRDIRVDVKRGQIAWSENRLAKRWGWSRTKVRKFLNDLEKEQQLIQQKNKVTQVITLKKYEYYQEKEPQKDHRKTTGRPQEDLLKEIKEVKEDKRIIYSFIEKDFEKTFIDWLEYKKAKKQSYKSEKSIQAAYNKLKKLSSNDPEIAAEIVEQSMANNWAGLFELKNQRGFNPSDTRTQPNMKEFNGKF